jgi:hypothetical protein
MRTNNESKSIAAIAYDHTSEMPDRFLGVMASSVVDLLNFAIAFAPKCKPMTGSP